ncbi:FAD-binding domain-containing protein [Lojkania enalia]|uniref:FAD-binding domain-containing protein n=1 Tax=Lojkania enalia TaxID=147567 RepID=A0A9P4TQK9_9PLEO|nr:FAD-binding domain-containing protein [Didymosphaeria enalia]
MGLIHSSWLLFIYFSSYLSVVHAAIPDRNLILAQLEKNGACCTTLDYFLPNKVHLNDILDVEYQQSQQSFWSAQERSLNPTCIVIPTSTQDVSIAVSILYVAYEASVNGCQFAVRGAGHTPHAGAANIDGGVTIDMQSMDQVTVSADQQQVSVGSGNRFGNIYTTLDDLNLVMTAGRVSTVGIGGLTIGGGVSFFSGRYGFACDNINAFEIVLANGTITTASSASNPSLFRALKGGNNNFGIVTRFDAKLRPQTAFWGGTISQPITNKEAFYDFFTNFTISANYDPYSALISIFAWVSGVPTIIHTPVYTDGDVAWPPPTFAPLDAMPKLSTTIRKAKLSKFTDEIATTASPTTGRYNLFVTVSYVNDPEVASEFMAEIFDLTDNTINELLTVVGLIPTLTFQPLPHVLYSKSSLTGGNVLGLDRFQYDLVNVLYTISWQFPTDSERVETAFQELEAAIIAKAKERGIYNEWIYLNYAAQWQDPIQSYGSANVQFLREVSRQYDPSGLFQEAVPGGFKLGI